MSPHRQALKYGILSHKGSKLNINWEHATFPRQQLDLCSQDPTLMLPQRSHNSFQILNVFLKNKETKWQKATNKTTNPQNTQTDKKKPTNNKTKQSQTTKNHHHHNKKSQCTPFVPTPTSSFYKIIWKCCGNSAGILEKGYHVRGAEDECGSYKKLQHW